MDASERWDAAQIVARAPVRPFRGLVWRAHWKLIAADDWGLSIRSSGRYHRGEDLHPPTETFPALYTSLAPEIAVWELVRRSATRNLAYLQNNVLSELDVNLQRVLDLSDPAVVGLDRAILTGSDMAHCRALAATARVQQIEALLVPSAAMHGTNLVVLPSNLEATALIRVSGHRELLIERLAQGDKMLPSGGI